MTHSLPQSRKQAKQRLLRFLVQKSAPPVVEAHITVRGRVQHVGFRDFIVRQAKELSINGYAENRNDGKLVVLAQGLEQNIALLLGAIRHGPHGSRIDRVSISYHTPSSLFSSFVVKEE